MATTAMTTRTLMIVEPLCRSMISEIFCKSVPHRHACVQEDVCGFESQGACPNVARREIKRRDHFPVEGSARAGGEPERSRGDDTCSQHALRRLGRLMARKIAAVHRV